MYKKLPLKIMAVPSGSFVSVYPITRPRRDQSELSAPAQKSRRTRCVRRPSLSKKTFQQAAGLFEALKKLQKVVSSNVKGNPDGSLSHYPSLRSLWQEGLLLASAAAPVACGGPYLLFRVPALRCSPAPSGRTQCRPGPPCGPRPRPGRTYSPPRSPDTPPPRQSCRGPAR